jgi:hypothetical protein
LKNASDGYKIARQFSRRVVAVQGEQQTNKYQGYARK